MSSRERVATAIARNDLDELIRISDDLASECRWDDLLDLRDSARGAFEDTGRQLWPAASWAEYRVALHGRDDLMDEVLVPGTGMFAPGPLTEVAAQHHRWASVATYLPEGPVAALFAHECAAHGEIIEETVVAADVLAVPLVRSMWEPEYLLATYTPTGIETPSPVNPSATRPIAPEVGEALDDEDSAEAGNALRGVAENWATQSEANIVVVAVAGNAANAIAACGIEREARIAEISAQDGLRWLAWAGASGGQRGRRRGAAAGRDAAWHAAAALCGFDPHEQVDQEELGEAIAELRWSWFGASDALVGHVVRLVIEDPVDGVAFAISAVDAP